MNTNCETLKKDRINIYREKRYDFIRAIATLLILIWHWNTTCSEYGIALHFTYLANTSGTINPGGGRCCPILDAVRSSASAKMFT